jgi:abhydrolase domain-containing protein 6
MVKRTWAWVLPLFLFCACGGERLYRAAIGWERYRASMKAKVVQAADHEVHYLELLPPTQPGKAQRTLVLVHGFGVDKDTWVRFVQALAAGEPDRDRFRIIAIDLPGFGESTRNPALSYDIESQAKRLHAILEALGVHHASFVGNSMGGAISTFYALTYPSEVESLALFDSAGVKCPRMSEKTVKITPEENPLVVRSEADFDRLLSLTFVQQPSIPGSVKAYFLQRGLKNQAFNDKVFRDIRVPGIDLSERLRELKTPTHIVWGDTDRIIDPSCAEVFAAGIAGSQLVVMKDTGHGPMLERPTESAKLYLDFIKR